MRTLFVNEVRELVGWDTESGADVKEIHCPECGEWCSEFGDVSVQSRENPSVHEFVCRDCGDKLSPLPVGEVPILGIRRRRSLRKAARKAS